MRSEMDYKPGDPLVWMRAMHTKTSRNTIPWPVLFVTLARDDKAWVACLTAPGGELRNVAVKRHRLYDPHPDDLGNDFLAELRRRWFVPPPDPPADLLGRPIFDPPTGAQLPMFHEPVDVKRPGNDTPADARIRRQYDAAATPMLPDTRKEK